MKDARTSGCAFVKDRAMVTVRHPFDIVITTNSGFPLDLNLYQSVKGMSAAAKVVKSGGAIILVAECRDGLPDHGLYGSLLQASPAPADLLAGILASEEDQQDQWQTQIKAVIQLKADVYLYSGGLSDEQIRSVLLKPARDIEAAVGKLVEQYGRRAEICILPEGPQTIPYVEA